MHMKNMHALLLLALLTVCLAPLQMGGADRLVSLNKTDIDHDIHLMSEIMPTQVRVAVYDERNDTLPRYIDAASVAQNGTVMAQFLASLGFAVSLVNVTDILNHRLNTLNFDVLVLPDSLPRESITDLVKEFWLGGGGILSMDSVAGYLGYSGILPAESEGDDGGDIYWRYWDYPAINMYMVSARHPVTKGHTLNEDLSVPTYDFAHYNWTALSTTADHAGMTKLLTNIANSEFAPGVAYEPTERGGRVVHLACYGDNIIESLQNILYNAVRWLAPRPVARVVYDLSHIPWYGTDSWDKKYTSMTNPKYSAFRDLLVAHGFLVDKLYPSLSGNLTMERLSGYDVLIISLPWYNFTAAEVDTVSQWLSRGKGLFVLGDHTGLYQQDRNINWLLSRYNLKMNLTADGYNGLYMDLTTHFVTDACGVICPANPGKVAVTSPAEPIVEDVAHGSILTAIQSYNTGRIVLQADVNVQAIEYIGSYSNSLYTLNIMNWLAATGADTLVLTTEPYSVNRMRTPSTEAVRELGLDFQLIFTSTILNWTLKQHEWHLVIIDMPYYELTEALDALADYVRNGGMLLVSYYWARNDPSHPLWPLLGFVPVMSIGVTDPVYIWVPGHPVFNRPVDYGATQFNSTIDYGTTGCLLHVFDNATSLAGHTSAPTANKSLIVERNDGKTIYVSYLIDQFEIDNDNSYYMDNFELWLNLISYMLRPTISSPADVEYTHGTTGHSISWSAESYHPSSYTVTRNGTTVVSTTWSSSQITVNVDGLAVGLHVYVIRVYDWAGHYAEDTVLVRVTPAAVTIPFDNMTLLLIAVAVVILLGIGGILARRRGTSSPPPPPKARRTTSRPKKSDNK